MKKKVLNIKEEAMLFSTRANEQRFRQGVIAMATNLKEDSVLQAMEKLIDHAGENLTTQGYKVGSVKLNERSFDYGYKTGYAYSIEGKKDPDAKFVLLISSKYEKMLANARAEIEYYRDVLKYFKRARSIQRVREGAKKALL